MSTMNIADLRKRPSTTYLNHPSGLAAKAQMYGYLPNGHFNKPQSGPMFYQHPSASGHNVQAKDNGDVADSLGRLSLQSGAYTGLKNNSSHGNESTDYNTTGMAQQQGDLGSLPFTGIPQAYIYNGQLMLAGHQFPQGGVPTAGVAPGAGMYNGHFGAQHNYAGYPPHMINNHSPMSQWASSRAISGEMPTIITPRRDSTSSNEHDIPGTPFTQYSYSGFRPGVAVTDHSPNSLYAWSTPNSARGGYHAAKMSNSPSLSPRLQLLIQQHPAIPRAVPAPYSPMKPLDRSLENPNGVTNVYIRGLQPETSDELLSAYVTRFGDVVSSKSIIDHSTGLCKGFGFSRFHSYKDAEDCIRAMHSLGYEAAFARESYYSMLKKLGDTSSTNLYISNLPPSMNEHELSMIFEPKYRVASARILRDSSGHGKGVGFGRFVDRETCERVLAEFQGKVLEKDGKTYAIAIRFADSTEQKQLKQQTNAARTWRSAEYHSVTQFANNGPPSIADNSFEQYLTSSTANTRASDRLRELAQHLTPNASPSRKTSHAEIAEEDETVKVE